MSPSALTGLSIRELFASDVTRDIPPVVYFHEQQPAKLKEEVSEYIITGGWPKEHPNHRRVPNGIHEQYVRLLQNITAELDKAGGPDLPNSWISGFYGSGKSSFAKLLGLALDGVALPDGRSLAAALLERDTSPQAGELRAAWQGLRQKIDPVAVVFDVGGVARDDEHIHSVAVRRIQARLGYAEKSAHIAYAELEVERDGRWAELLQRAQARFGKPWDTLKNEPQAQGRFSALMADLYPEVYSKPLDWLMGHGGLASNTLSPEEAITAIRDMLQFRAPTATLFLVIDEVSQYVVANKDRAERLRAFASALGSGLKGRVWLLALGQQRMEEGAGDSFIFGLKDRFPPSLRVHLEATNIRDVVHKRLLQKKPELETALRALFEVHRSNLKLYAYKGDALTAEEFVEVYPMLPEHIDLLLQITSALRARSSRAQGDDQAIRGLLQMLGELFRAQRLADQPVGALITLDQIYEVQHTALDSDVQNSMARILGQCADDDSGLLVRVAKVVALLELIQESVATSVELVSQCLYDRLDRGNQTATVEAALEDLRRRNLLSYSEKTGYKIQSSVGEEWERDRRDIAVPRESVAEIVQEALRAALTEPSRPRLQGRTFPWAAVFSDEFAVSDASLVAPREDAVVQLDFRFLPREDRSESRWTLRSTEETLEDRLLWVCGEIDTLEQKARELYRSRAMVRRHEPRKASLNAARKLLLQQENNRAEELESIVRKNAVEVWMAGRLYFRGRPILPLDFGSTFKTTLENLGGRILPELYPHFVATTLLPAELKQLIEPELNGPSPKYLDGELGILSVDGGRYMPTCEGPVPQRVLMHIDKTGGLSGAALITHFGSPPYGYPESVIKAAVFGLLRATRLRIQCEGTPDITAIRDAGTRDLLEKERVFRSATITLSSTVDGITPRERNRVCRIFRERLGRDLDREDHLIADAVADLFPVQLRRLRAVLDRLQALPRAAARPPELLRLQEALEACIAKSRHTLPTVQLVSKHSDALNDGLELLNLLDAEVVPEAIDAVRRASLVAELQLAQLEDLPAEQQPPDLASHAVPLRRQLSLSRPWREIGSLAPHIDAILQAYSEERTRRLSQQEALAEEVRLRVRAHSEFSTLTAEQAHSVLRPITLAVPQTSATDTRPGLRELTERFRVDLDLAEKKALELLDEIGASGPEPRMTVKVNCRLRGRELASTEDVEALLSELRATLMAQLEAGHRVRLLG